MCYYEKYQQLFMENRVRAIKGTKKAEDHLRDCQIKVLSYWTVEVHNCSEIEFIDSTRHLYMSNRDISHLCYNALCIRLDHLSAEPHKHV